MHDPDRPDEPAPAPAGERSNGDEDHLVVADRSPVSPPRHSRIYLVPINRDVRGTR